MKKLRHRRTHPSASVETVTLATRAVRVKVVWVPGGGPLALSTEQLRAEWGPGPLTQFVQQVREREAVAVLVAACESRDPSVIRAILEGEAERISRAKMAAVKARPTVRRSKAEDPKPEFRWPAKRETPFPQGVDDDSLDDGLPEAWRHHLDLFVYREAFTETADAAEMWATLSTSLAETWEVETAKWYAQQSPSFKDGVSPPPPLVDPRLRDARAAISFALALAPYVTRGRPLKNDPKRQKLRDAIAVFDAEKIGKLADYMTLESSLRDMYVALRVSKRGGLDPLKWRESLEARLIEPNRDDFLALVRHMYAHGNMSGGGLKDGTWPASRDLQEKKAARLADGFRERRRKGLRPYNPLIAHAVEGNLVTRLARILIDGV